MKTLVQMRKELEKAIDKQRRTEEVQMDRLREFSQLDDTTFATVLANNKAVGVLYHTVFDVLNNLIGAQNRKRGENIERIEEDDPVIKLKRAMGSENPAIDVDVTSNESVEAFIRLTHPFTVEMHGPGDDDLFECVAIDAKFQRVARAFAYSREAARTMLLLVLTTRFGVGRK